MVTYVRQSTADILPDEEVRAEPLNAEFNRLQAAFGTTGHTHDGVGGNGPKISLASSVFGYLPAINGGTGGANNNMAVTAPTINDDQTKGYVPGSLWLNTAGNAAYINVNNQPGEAVWNLIQAPTGTFLTPGNNLSDVSNKETSRTNLGVSIGSDVQAYSAKLTDIAAITIEGRVPFLNGGSYAGFNTSVFSRGLMNNSTASGWKSGIGLGNVDDTSDLNKPISTAQQSVLNSKLNASAKATGNQLRALTDDTNYLTSKTHADAMAFVPITANTSETHLATLLRSSFNLDITLIINTQMSNQSAATLPPGLSGVIMIKQDGTGGRTVSWGTFYDFGADGPPTIRTAANAVDYIFYVVKGASGILCTYKEGS